MQDYEPAYCPKCKLGFAPDTRICPGCNLPLRSTSEADAGAPAPAALQEELSSLQLLRSDSPAWIRHLQESLDEAGVPYRAVITARKFHRVSLYVRREDFERASRIDREVYKMEVPGTAEIPHAADLDFTVCPGCGSALEEFDRECGSCGLRLSVADPTCSVCEQKLDDEARICPNCGAETY